MTVYYLDNNRGNDSNDGLSALAPWKNLSKIAAVTAATPGDAFLLADDSLWRLNPTQRVVPPTTWTGIQKNPVVIGKYSPSSQSIGQRPLIIMNAETVPADWTYDAALNGWKYLYPTAHINNAALLLLADSWLASATDNNSDTAVESVDGRYKARTDNQTLVLFAPAGTNPVDYYGKVVVGAQAGGAFSLSSGRRAITVRGLEFFETGCGVSCYSSTADPAVFVIEDCRMRRGCLATLVGASGGNLRAWVRHNEVTDFGSIGLQVNSTGGAGIAHAELAQNKVSDGVRQWAQAGIYLQCRNAAREAICFVHHNEVSHCRWGTQDKAYDGCGIYLETGADGCMVFANEIHDCFTALQDNSGRRNFITGNVVRDCRRGIRITDENNNNQSDTRLYNNTFLVGDLRQRATEFGNTIQGADYPGIWAYKGTGTLNVIARNNIIANIGGQRGRAAFGLPGIHAASAYDFNTNWVYGFEADTLRGDTNAVPSPAPSITHAGTADPRPYLGTDGRLKTPLQLDSPAVRNPLGGAGAYIPGVRLLTGRRLDPARVPVGACNERLY